MEETTLPKLEGSDRRREQRIWVPAVAVVRSGTQPPAVWRVSNLSLGGAGLVGDGSMATDRFWLCLHVAGFPALELQATILRRQILTRAGRCAVRFLDLTEGQAQALHAILVAAHAPSEVRRRALLVTPSDARARTLSGELATLGFAVRREASPGQALAWLQREEMEILLVDESLVEADRWSLLQFVRTTAPEVRRLVIASDVRGFRLYYAIKAGLVDGLVEPTTAGESLARHLTGAPAAVSPRRGYSAR